METIKDTDFGGERPLFARRNLLLEDVTIHTGESALKAGANIRAVHCRFEGKYPFWHVDGAVIEDSVFTPGGRAAIWYSRNIRMSNTAVDAPKMFREVEGLSIDNVRFSDAEETLWHCSDVTIRHSSVVNADYLFMHGANIDIDGWEQHGNYSFQYCRNVVIRNAEIHSKDAFWNTDSVTVYDSVLNGEYLGWYSNRLHLVRCRIAGTQPLCYCRNLVLDDCVFDDDADLAFEDSEVTATILSNVRSIKNPRAGRIAARSVGSTIIDGNSRAVDPVEICESDKTVRAE